MSPPSQDAASFGFTLKHTVVVLPLVVLSYLYISRSSPGSIVQINNGIIQGVDSVSRDGNPFVEFFGIPYATPPIGHLRFEPPLPPQNWDGIRQATKYGSRCLQIEFLTTKLAGNEDCLYLNVFTPKLPVAATGDEDGISQKTPKLMPVMVFIHGGYFMSGGSDAFPPSYFMENGLDTVLVTINYRVASLGFLNTGDDVVRGNMGLKDQNMALRWVQANIHHFGGDKERVTIFGCSAGASAVHYHTLSPMSKGLFAKVITQSGSAIKARSFVDQPKEQAKILGEKLNCPTGDSRSLVTCLKGLDAGQIMMTHREYTNILLEPLVMFAPSIEGVHDENTFLSKHPYDILQNGEQADVPMMSGLNSDEGLLATARILRNPEMIRQVNEDWANTAPKLLAFSEYPNKAEISAQALKFYLGDPASIDFLANVQNFTNMASDRLYFTASRETALLHSQKSPVYMYYYVYRAQFSFSSLVLSSTGRLPVILDLWFTVATKWMNRAILGRSEPTLGVSHGDENLLLFGMGFMFDVKAGDIDYKMSQGLVKLWTDFAAAPYGSDLKFQGVTWSPRHYPAEPQPQGSLPMTYLQIDSNSQIVKEPFTERMDFWKNLGMI